MIEALLFTKLLKLTGEIAEVLGYEKDSLQLLGWTETPEGGINITLTEKGDDRAITFILPVKKEAINETI